MTAFAGSIGIIGIAAILALSNGVNEYIAKVEEDTLSSYPLSITKQSYDMSGMLGESAPDRRQLCRRVLRWLRLLPAGRLGDRRHPAVHHAQGHVRLREVQ